MKRIRFYVKRMRDGNLAIIRERPSASERLLTMCYQGAEAHVLDVTLKPGQQAEVEGTFRTIRIL